MLEPLLPGTPAEAAKAMARLKALAEMVIHWNRTVSNVMSKHDEPRIVTRHLLESLAPVRTLRGYGLESWMDFGSGAGFPAIPLAIAGVGSSWLLVESRRQKTLFLRKAIESLELRNVQVATSRLEVLEEDRQGFDRFTSRATERLERTLELAAPRVRPGGMAILWRGSARAGEMDAGAWQEQWEAGSVTRLPDSLAELAEFTRRSTP
jgi:16S rRNA (guanine527-N7)-methyltransferase